MKLSPKRELLIFDLDDTLLDTSTIYYQCRQEFIDFLGVETDLADLRYVFEDYDAQNIKLFGYAPWRYTYTMIEVYLSLARTKVITFNIENLVKIVEIGRRIEQCVPELRSGASKLLEILSDNYELAILTRGKKSLQWKKLRHHGLDRIFTHIFIVEQKSVETFQHILTSTSTEPEMAWSIGDSPKWDIFPAYEAGLKTILVKYEHSDYEWDHEERNLWAPVNTAVVHDLMEIPRIIA